MNVNSATVLLLLTALLVGCNDDGNTDTSTPEPTVDKKGWAEQELYHPVTHPDGTFLAAGHTGVLFLEAPTTAPAQGDTATVGEDEIWINLIRGGALALQIDDANLATIARIQLWDEAGGLTTTNALPKSPSRPVDMACASWPVTRKRRSRRCSFGSLRTPRRAPRPGCCRKPAPALPSTPSTFK